jgi:hypothetical protein
MTDGDSACEHRGGRFATVLVYAYDDSILGIRGAVLVKGATEASCRECG